MSLIAQRLSARLQSGELLARTGGDEFVLVQTPKAGSATDRASYAQRLLERAEKLLAGVREPAQVQGRPLELTASAGVAVFPDDGDSPSEILRNAGLAASAAKHAGRNRALVFRHDLGNGEIDRYEKEAALRRAITEAAIQPYYQPKVDAASGALLGAEALARWPKPEGGFHAPASFLTLAEDCGLMEPLDDLLIVSVMRQVAAWQPRLPTGFRIAVNISSHRFHDGQLPARMREWLKTTGADPRHLELEITEGALIGDTESCAAQLQELRALGLELTLDDFGTGYSSLSYLKRLPLQHLKVDQSFVRDIERNANDAAIVQAVVALARALKLETVTEGVETASQLRFVYELGCHTVQGFLFSPAVAADTFGKWIDAGRVVTVTAG